MNKKFFTSLLVVLLIFVCLPAFCNGSKEDKKTESKPAAKTEKVEEKKEETAPVVESTPASTNTKTTTISAPVAKITYGESTYTIKRDEVSALMASAKESGVELSEDDAILNLTSQLLIQMKLNEIIKATPQEDLTQMGLYAISEEASNYYGIKLTNQEDFEKYCQAYHNTDLESYWSYSVQNYIFMKYLAETYTDIFEQYQVKDEYVVNLYNSSVEKNPNAFEVGPFVKLAHILFAFSDSEAKNATRERAQKVYNNITSGAASFEACAAQSDDASSRDNAGLIPGYAEKDSDLLTYYFGQDASDIIFALKKGEVSKIVEGPIGLHIFKAVDFVDRSVIGLDDKLNPGSEDTLRDYLAYQISGQLESEAFAAAQNKLISDLISQAEIKRYN